MLIQSGPFEGLRRHGYRAILMDVPWSFLVRSDKGKDRSAERHYATMTLDEIKALPVRDLAHPDGCVLHFWVIDTHLEMALDVIRHRLVLSYEALSDNVSADDLLKKIIARIPVPEVPLRERSNA